MAFLVGAHLTARCPGRQASGDWELGALALAPPSLPGDRLWWWVELFGEPLQPAIVFMHGHARRRDREVSES